MPTLVVGMRSVENMGTCPRKRGHGTKQTIRSSPLPGREQPLHLALQDLKLIEEAVLARSGEAVGKSAVVIDAA